MEGKFSWRDMLRDFSEKSMALLSTDITRLSRAERRRRECERRGVHLSVSSERQYVLQGILGTGAAGNFAVNGSDVEIDESTWVFGDLEYGAHVTAMIGEQADGRRKVKKIIIQAR